MQANEILDRLRDAFAAEAKKFPAVLATEITVYFQDEKGNEKEVFSAADKTFEAWGELTLSATGEDGQESDAPQHTFPVMIAVGEDGRVNDEEVAETLASLTETAEEFLARMEQYGDPLAFLAAERAEEERKYREELEKFNLSMKNFKRTVIYTAVGAVAVLLIMLLLNRFLR